METTRDQLAPRLQELRVSGNMKRNLSAEMLSGMVSAPPTQEELDNYQDLASNQLPPAYKRDLLDRVFVNRDLRLDRIKWIGFDMDYTLAQYISPAYETLTYNLLVERLLEMGYPDVLKTFQYDPSFPVRGLILDRVLGNFLKIDAFGHINTCVHGRTLLSKKETSEFYPSLFIASNDVGKRFFPLSTLFSLPEISLFADMLEYFEKRPSLTGSQDSLSDELSQVSYPNIFSDIRVAIDWIHINRLKQETVKDLPKYIKRTDTKLLFKRLRDAGFKTFLLTNSEYWYTREVMAYLLDTNKESLPWQDYFDVAIVNGRKPLFFGEGTTLREVNIDTGNLKIGTIDSFKPGRVYEGGSIKLFEKNAQVKGNQVLYVGDHIYADIIKSKKMHAWRTLLIIPELEREINVWKSNSKLYNHLRNLEFMKAEAYRGLDSAATEPPDTSALRASIKSTVVQLNNTYNSHFGSLFRSGTKQSQFSMQVQRYADLYTYDYLNLLNYPLFYHFTAENSSLPHEVTNNDPHPILYAS
eukprot:TRINITY_DN5778_c0_g1_i2.p1 TRINITY_DN5778_c0_g1~~TRINITY_DN5778_c0_g1_i2.p1  ORF type:complete len:526 (-),score=132.72 TRINITY_DN5778_c0_g1_i2:56-1633(-)